MTSREKAEEIYSSFYSSGYIGGYGRVPECYQEAAKGCALIAIDEIIENLKHDSNLLEWQSLKKNFENYIINWQEVRKEIELL